MKGVIMSPLEGAITAPRSDRHLALSNKPGISVTFQSQSISQPFSFEPHEGNHNDNDDDDGMVTHIGRFTRPANAARNPLQNRISTNWDVSLWMCHRHCLEITMLGYLFVRRRSSVFFANFVWWKTAMKFAQPRVCGKHNCLECNFGQKSDRVE